MFHRTVVLALAAAAIALPAVAAERNDPSRSPAAKKEASRSLSTKADPANVGDVRYALHFDFENGVTRQKGIATVRNPSEGLYCIKPSRISASALDRLVPSVTVDYSASAEDVMMAYYRSTAGACKKTEFGVFTMALINGDWQPSDNVGFTVVAD